MPKEKAEVAEETGDLILAVVNREGFSVQRTFDRHLKKIEGVNMLMAGGRVFQIKEKVPGDRAHLVVQ